MEKDNEARRRQARAGAAAPTTAVGGEKMIFNMVGPISDTAVQSAVTDREVAAAETEPPQEA